MTDLICRKTMMRCQTPGMCSPFGGCQPSALADCKTTQSNSSAAPRQPEGDSKPDRNKAFDACPDAGCDWGAFWQGWKACHADHLRAIAELRDRLDMMTQCADNYSRMSEESAEEGSKLAVLLREAIPDVEFSIGEGYKERAALFERIVAALAEVNK